MATKHDTQVVIAGGGPVGMGLAIELGQRGIRCVVVERHQKPQPVPKGQNLTQRTMEHFHAWGAEAELRAARTVPAEHGIGGLTAYRTLLGDYHYDWLQRGLVRPYYFTDNERLPQYATERVLRARVAELPSVEVMYGWQAEDIAQDDAGCRVTIREREGERQRTLTARYAVGCDGSRSVMREAAGIAQTLSDHDRRMVLLVFRSRGLHELLQRYPGKSFFNVLHPELEGYWLFLGRVDLGTTWFFHAPVPSATTEDNYDFRALLHRAVGASFEVEFEHVGFWDLRFATAKRYRAGRVFIAGDAAHSHPPYGGYGINTGFEDARNLGWKLAAALDGWGGEELLDSYDGERRPVFESTARDFIEKSIRTDRDFLATYDPETDRAGFEAAWRKRSSGAPSEVRSFQPNYRGSTVVWGSGDGVCDAVAEHAVAARAGYHLTPHALSDGANVYDCLGQGFTLVAFDAPEAELSSFAEAARRLGVPLDIVADSGGDAPADYEASRILVRPDHFVVWASNEPAADPAAVLGRAVGKT